MSLFCLVVAIVLFVLVGVRANPAVLRDVDMLGLGLAFFAAAHLPWSDWIKR